MTGPMRICFVGDSLTLGVSDPAGLGWVGRLAQQERRLGMDLTAYNLGVRRDTSEDILRRWSAECSPRLPQTAATGVVFAFGTNDCLEENGKRRVPLEETLSNLEKILRAARVQHPVLMVGPPPTGDASECERIGVLSNAMRCRSGELNVPYFDTFELLAGKRDWATEVASVDCYHPSSNGYALIADAVHEWPRWRSFLEQRRG